MKKQVLIIGIGLLTLGSFAQKKELKLIEKALSASDYGGALSTLKTIEGSIEGADAKYKSKYYFYKGKALSATKKYSEAVQSFETLKAFEKKTGKKLYTAQAAGIEQKMVESVSDEALDLYNNKKDYKAAAGKFYLIYKLSPRDTSFVYNAAVSSTQAKDYAAALKLYKELKDIGYTGIEKEYIATKLLGNLVEVFPSATERDVAVKIGKYVKPAIRTTESKSATIVKNIALILKEQGKTEEAVAAMKEAREANPKDLNLILNEAQLYVELEKMDEFGKLMGEAIALDPENPTLYYNLGVVNFNQGRVEEAKNYYKKAIELKPDYSDAYMNLAVTTLDKDRVIVEEMNKNLSNFKKYDQLALQQKGVYQEALPYLEKADSLSRNLDTVRTLMGIYEVLEMSGKASEFRTLYNSMK